MEQAQILSGRFVLRIAPELHNALVEEASHRRVSLNHLCNQLLQSGLTQKETRHFEFLSPVIDQLKGYFDKELLGVIVFGSQVTGKATQSSDLDLLIALASSHPLTRSLYRFWDSNIDPVPNIEINPQFAHLPSSVESAGSLWLEIAMGSKIILDENGKLHRLIKKLREFIATDSVRRYFSNGQPYWVSRHEEQGTR